VEIKYIESLLSCSKFQLALLVGVSSFHLSVVITPELCSSKKIIFKILVEMLLPRLCSLCPKILISPIRSSLHTTAMLPAKRWKDKSTASFTSEFSNPVREVAGMEAPPPEKGFIYDTKPHRVTVQAGCSYTWCGCGLARTQQPYCDLACKNLMSRKIVKGGPVRYIAPETKDLWLCNCKQTNNAPFCDGTHRSDEIQESRLDSHRQLWEPRGRK